MAFLFRKKKPKVHPSSGSTPPSSIDYRAVASTDVGSVRNNNEDNLIFIRPHDPDRQKTKGCVALVADGMGGHSSGEIASQMATEVIPRNYFDSPQDTLKALQKSFEKANRLIFKKAQEKAQLKGMGTTCTVVVLQGKKLFLGHVGDSRAYLFKGESPIQLSSDHTYVQHLLEQGLIQAEEVESHPDRNLITQAMGTAPQLKADYQALVQKLEIGNILMLCSDGLYEYISEEEWIPILRKFSLGEAAEKFISLAKQRGGHDNISILLVEAIPSATQNSQRVTTNLSLS